MKYGSDEGNLLVCCFHPYLSCYLKKKKTSVFPTLLLAVPGLCLIFTPVNKFIKKGEHFQACLHPNLLRKSEKHTISWPAGVCINIIDDVDCSHKAQILQLTTAARKAEVLKIYPHPSASSSFQILPVNGGS